MADIVNKTLCDRCIHHKVCTYKNDFISVVETIKRTAVTIAKCGVNGATMKNITDYDFAKDITVNCRYFSG